MLPVCVGLGWRPETAWLIDNRPRAAFSEVIAENIDPRRPPRALAAAIERGLVVVAHGIGLSLGGAEPPERGRIRRLATVAKTLRSPLVSEHVAFARAGRLEPGHFLPISHTRTQLALLVDHVRRVIDALPVPLALENIAAPLMWPGERIAEAEMLAELVERTGAQLLLDVANLRANALNHGADPLAFVDALPLARVAYLHAAGGARVDAMWRDTHAHPIDPDGLALLGAVLARTGAKPILVERDRNFGTRVALEAELDAVECVLADAPAVVSVERITPRPALPIFNRREIAAAQAALVRTVIDPQVAPPPGFSALHLAETRAILRCKHRH